MSEHLARLPELLGGHLRLTLVALLVGTLVSVPLGVAATRVRWVERVVMGLASIVQTIPGLALLAVMVPLLSAMQLSGIGMLPALIGLSLYSLLPILRNTVTGIREVDPALREAARGVGMTDGQQLRLVELPLAMPVIVAGIRTATVWVVGTATLATAVGAASLGNYIFEGLQLRDEGKVLFGCLAAAVLALSVDALIRAWEWAARERRRGVTRAVYACLGVAYLWVVSGAFAGGGVQAPVRIGTKTFTEQYILGELIAARVSETGAPVQNVPSLGSGVVFDALANGDIDVYVDYSGTIWSNVMHREGGDREQVLAEVGEYLERKHDVVMVGSFGFENAYALAVTRERAAALELARISDLVPHARTMQIGGDYEFFGRPEWKAVVETYRIAFLSTRSMEASLMYQAVRDGQVDVISAFSTDGRIDAFDLVVLEDDRAAIPPYDAVILVNGAFARARPEVMKALEGLVGTVDDARMRELNRAVDIDGASPAEAAARVGPTGG